MRFAYGTIGWHGSLDETFRAIADLAFEGVEMFDLLDRVEHDEDVGQMLAHSGLKLSAAYFGGSFVEQDRFPHELADFERTVDVLAALGSCHVVVGGGRVRRGHKDRDIAILMRNLNLLGRAAQKAGIQMGLHPHAGTLLSTPEQIAAAMDATDPELVKLAPDIAHLVRGGADPIAFLRQYVDRVVYVHLKDLAGGEFAELGRGELPIVDFCRVLEEHDYVDWATVELDASEDPAESARVNARFVKEQLGAGIRPPHPR